MSPKIAWMDANVILTVSLSVSVCVSVTDINVDNNQKAGSLDCKNKSNKNMEPGL